MQHEPSNPAPQPPDAKLTFKQEAFSQAMVSLGPDGKALSESDCYRANYACSNMSPPAIHVEASRLAALPKVALRIQELRQATEAALATKRLWDRERFIDEAERNLTQARDLGQMAPANGALQLIGKATGIVQEQQPSQETALDAIIKLASAMTDQALRLQAAGSTVPVVDGESKVLDDE